MGTDLNLVRLYSDSHNRQDTFIKVQLVVLLLSSLLSFVIYGFKDVICDQLFKMPELKEYFSWVVITIPFWALIVNFGGYYRAHRKNFLFALFNNSGRFILAFLFLILMFRQTDDLIPIKAHFYAVLALFIICLIVYLKTSFNNPFKSNIKTVGFIKDSLPMMISETALLFLIFADTIVLGIYEDQDSVGIYNVAFKVAALTSFTLQAFNSILAPKVAKYFKEGNSTSAQKIIRFSTNANFYLTLVIVLLIIFFSKEILGLFGREFVKGKTILLILAGGQLINSLSGSVGVILQMSGHQKVYRNLILIAFAVNLILNFTLTPIYGGVGAAISTVISLSLWNIYGMVYIKRKLGLVSFFNTQKITLNGN